MLQNIPPTCRQPFYTLLCGLWLAALPMQSYAKEFRLIFPVDCRHGQTCWILNYMDMASAWDDKRDFRCGPRTEDGKQGTDIAVRDLSTAGAGVAVLAAADGTVSRVMEGISDQILKPGEAERLLPIACGNMVVIDHAGGWQTTYCHLKQESTTVRPGTEVKAGQPIGAIGLSGVTSWPKLEFIVTRNQTPYDPFGGRTAREGCGLSADSLWADPAALPYRAFAIYNLGFDMMPPAEDKLDVGTAPVEALPTNAPALTFWATIFDALSGDRVEMSVLDPRGNEIMAISTTLPNDQKKRLVSLTKEREGIWKEGIYTGTIRVVRGVGKEQQVSEWSSKVMMVNP